MGTAHRGPVSPIHPILLNSDGGCVIIYGSMADIALNPMVESVQVVSLEIPLERRSAIEEFYIKLLGFAPWPSRMRIPGGWGVSDGRNGIHFPYRHDPTVDARRRRLSLTVVSLEELTERLAERGIPYRLFRGLLTAHRVVHVHDPAGHLLEIRASTRI